MMALGDSGKTPHDKVAAMFLKPPVMSSLAHIQA